MSERDENPKGYGNIYTPHAGSMIIQVQREGGLANRTLILSPRQVRLLRFLGSRIGIGVGLLVIASWAFFAVQAARVPLLTSRIVRMERDAKRLDTLERALSTLQGNYSQVQHMLGASPAARTAQPAAPASIPASAPPERAALPRSSRLTRPAPAAGASVAPAPIPAPVTDTAAVPATVPATPPPPAATDSTH